MPKDPKRNIPSYQIEGGHLNEFEFQKSQSEMAEESKSPLTGKTEMPELTQAKRVAEVTAEAHKKVEKRKKRGSVAGGKQKGAARKGPRKKPKGPPKKIVRKSAKKKTTPAGTKKRAHMRSGRKKRRAD